MEPILTVKDLRVSFHSYNGEVQAVRGVNFSLSQGETLAIVGESGCGKSVTAKTIMGLLQNTTAEAKPGSQILFNGENILSYSDAKWRNYRGKECAMIFQDAMTSLNPTLTVGWQIAETFVRHRKMSRQEAMKEAIRMMELVGIPNAEKRAKQYPHEFSGGQRQRIMIAIALALNPKILIADEPTTALDVTVQAQILALMRKLQTELGTAIILITHDMGVVAGFADKIAVMYSGKIVEEGRCREIFYSPKHPYTKALLGAVPSLDAVNKQPLVAIQGMPPNMISPPQGCGFAARCAECMKVCALHAPEKTVFENSQSASCWKYHPMAKQSAEKQGQ